jgi:plasmid stabilization system protein ParE
LKIIKDEIFTHNFQDILRFIAQDSKVRAIEFNKTLFKKINDLPNNPYKFRQSFYYDNTHVRDFIYKGYTLPYLIDKTNNLIILLDIFKWSDR